MSRFTPKRCMTCRRVPRRRSPSPRALIPIVAPGEHIADGHARDAAAFANGRERFDVVGDAAPAASAAAAKASVSRSASTIW